MSVDTPPQNGQASEGAQVARVPVNVGVPLKGLDEAYRLAQNLSLAQLVPEPLRGKPADVLAILLYGQELGLAPMQAIQAIYVVKGKPQLAAQTWIALARRAGHRVAVLEHTEDSCTVEVVRGDSGESHTETFTIADASKAGLAGAGGMYSKYPKRMTLARAVSNACRFACPEIALGFYAEGEQFDDDEAKPRPTLQQVAAARDDARPTNVDAHGEIHDAEVVDDSALRAEMLAAEAEYVSPIVDPDVDVEDPPAELLALADEDGGGWPEVAQPARAAKPTRS